MATLTADMKTFIENNLAWITTVDKDGNLDLGPKMSMFVLDDNHLAYHERTAGPGGPPPPPPPPPPFWSFDTGFRATLSAAAGSGTATENRRRLDVSGCGNDAPAA